MKTIVAIVPDLMDRSRIDAALAVTVSYVAGIDALDDLSPDVVVVDLARIADPNDLRGAAPTARIIAFGSHVDDQVLESAREAGIDDVMPRSAFFRRLPRLFD